MFGICKLAIDDMQIRSAHGTGRHRIRTCPGAGDSGCRVVRTSFVLGSESTIASMGILSENWRLANRLKWFPKAGVLPPDVPARDS